MAHDSGEPRLYKPLGGTFKGVFMSSQKKSRWHRDTAFGNLPLYKRESMLAF